MVSSSTRHTPRVTSSSAWAHDRAPAPFEVCARSPTTVIDRDGQRRATARHAIGESSCASSTTTWPYAQSRSPAARSASVSTGPLSTNRDASSSPETIAEYASSPSLS